MPELKAISLMPADGNDDLQGQCQLARSIITPHDAPAILQEHIGTQFGTSGADGLLPVSSQSDL